MPCLVGLEQLPDRKAPQPTEGTINLDADACKPLVLIISEDNTDTGSFLHGPLRELGHCGIVLHGAVQSLGNYTCGRIPESRVFCHEPGCCPETRHVRPEPFVRAQDRPVEGVPNFWQCGFAVLIAP